MIRLSVWRTPVTEECVLLNSGKVAFYYDQTCVGYEMDIKGESSLPQPVREFTEKYFPDGTFEAVIEHIPDGEFPAGYTFWLENGFKCVLMIGGTVGAQVTHGLGAGRGRS